MRTALLACILLVALLAGPFTGPAAAHCEQPVFLHPGACEAHGALEEAVDRFNAASGGSIAWVVMKDFRFHPEVVTVRSGGTVVFLHGDPVPHDPASSGSCGSQAADLARCVPSHAGACFQASLDQGGRTGLGGTYPVTLRYLPAVPRIQKSHGFFSGTVVGDATGAQPFRDCPSGSSSNEPASAVLPYHCTLHGGVNTSVKEMRGAIVVTPALP